MEGLTPIHLEQSHLNPASLTQLINRQGSPDFHTGLFQFIAEASNAEHCGVYLLSERDLQKPGAFSKTGQANPEPSSIAISMMVTGDPIRRRK
ncbi:hypothetical protein [Bradyrhizobium sp. USDA 4506]